MSSKHKTEKNKKASHSTPTPQKARTILRNLPLEQGFCFYEAINKPIGQVTTNLLDFCNKLASAKSLQAQTSLAFHTRRGDFAAWIKETVGDSELADKIGKADPNNPRLAKSLCKTVDVRIKQLKRVLIEYAVVPEDQHITLSVQRTR